MNTESFFSEILEIQPKDIYGAVSEYTISNEQIEELRKGIETDKERLLFYLIDKNDKDRNILLEIIIEKLLYAYYNTRLVIKKSDKDQVNSLRKAMFLFEEAIISTIMLSWDLKIIFDEVFINEWEAKCDYFPFGKLLRSGKPRPFAKRSITKAKREPVSERSKKEKNSSKFSDLIQFENKEELLKRLHFLIDVCSMGTDIAAILSKATLDKYLIRLPNKEEVNKEFKLPCTWEAIRKNLIDDEKLKADKRYKAAQKVVIFE